jgi:group I intron endonuclease
MFSLYWIVNTVTMKGYVGFTGRTFERRFEQHKKSARNGSTWLLHASMRKHGVENFRVYHLSTVADRAAAVALETRFIVDYATRAPLGYNMTDGGDGATGYRHTEEWKTELGRRGRGRKCSPEQVAAMSTRMLGWVPSDETRQRMGESQRGRKHSSETIQKMSESAVRRWQENPAVMTPERIAHLQTLAVGAVRTPEHRAAVSKALKGKPKSPETRAKMAAAAVLRHQRRRAGLPPDPG